MRIQHKHNLNISGEMSNFNCSVCP